MAAPILQLGCTVQCPHGGVGMPVNTNTRVLVAGSPALVFGDRWNVLGCTFTLGPKPAPCTTIVWTNPSIRTHVLGRPVLLQTSIGICISEAGGPPVPALVAGVQPMVEAT
ncbi:MAG: hypothetical protein V4510_10535 [bacterium]